MDWIDACTHEDPHGDFGVTQHSVGWLVAEMDEGLRLCRTLNNKNGDVEPEELLDIPHGMILSVRTLS